MYTLHAQMTTYTWFNLLAAVEYSAVRYRNSSFTFQLNKLVRCYYKLRKILPIFLYLQYVNFKHKYNIKDQSLTKNAVLNFVNK